MFRPSRTQGPEILTLLAQRRRRLALITLCSVVFITFLDTTVVSVALGDVQTRLHAGVSALQWVVNGYTLAFASLMLAFGSLSDRLGRKKILALGLVLFGTGSLLCGLAPNVSTLITGRVVMGVGAAACEPGTLSIIRHLYPEANMRARALASWAAVCGLGLAAGPVLGGALVGVGSFRSVFYFSLAAALVTLAATWRYVPESSDPTNAAFDYAGFVFGSGSLGAVAFAVILGEASGYGSALVLALFCIGAASLVTFVLVEARARLPMLELSYLSNPRFSGSLIVAFAVFFAIFSIFFFAALYLQVVDGFSGYRSALEFIPMTIGLVASSLGAGRLVIRFGPRALMSIGALIAGLAILWSDLALSRLGAPSPWLFVSLGLSGAGFGLCVVPVTTVVLGEVEPSRSGMAASATNTSRELGAVFGVAVLGALVNSSLTADLSHKLHALGIPSAFQAIVIGAVETGAVPSGGALAGDKKAFGPLVAKVISAAYGAFRSGLEVSLLVSGITMCLAGALGFVLLRPRAASL